MELDLWRFIEMLFGVQYVTTNGEYRTQESCAECYVMSEYKMKNTTLPKSYLFDICVNFQLLVNLIISNIL